MLLVRFLQHLKFKNAIVGAFNWHHVWQRCLISNGLHLPHKYDLVQTMSAWTMANFAEIVLQGSYKEILYLAVPACVLAYYFASQFSAASIGESFAKNIGLNYQRSFFIGVCSCTCAICASSVVMIVGVIHSLALSLLECYQIVADDGR